MAVSTRIYPGKTDQSEKIQSVLNLAYIHDIIFDFKEDVTLNKPITIPEGKSLIFRNNCKLVGTGTIDGGMIECNYLRQCIGEGITVKNLENIEVSVMWFGAKADYKYQGTAPTKNLQPILKAINSTLSPAIVRVPGANNILLGLQGFYYVEAPLIITRKIKLFGDGEDRTSLLFNGAGLGIKTTVENTEICDLTVRGQPGNISTGINSDIAHGIWLASARSAARRVSAVAFDGDGIRVMGDVTGGTNANLCILERPTANGNGRAGIFALSGDANACEITSANCTGNARYGIWEGSFLGNTWINPHVASNVIDHNFNKSFVTHLGNQYWCATDNVGIEPGVTPNWENYWTLQSPSLAPPFSNAWDKTTQWLSGGGYYVSDPNATAVFVKPYIEDDQAAFVNNGRSTIYGGEGSRMGSVRGSIGQRNGILSVPNLQALAPGNPVAPFMDGQTMTLGFQNSSGGQAFGLKGMTNGFRFNWAGLDATNIVYLSPYSYEAFGLKNTKGGGFFGSYEGIGHYVPGLNRFIRTFAGTEAPTVGEYSKGDICLNISDDNSFFAWKCTVGGTPGTWVKFPK